MASIDLQLLTVDEAAARAGVHRQTITRAADLGKIPEIRTSGHLRYRLYFTYEIDRWLATRDTDIQTSNRLRAERRQAITEEMNHHAAQHTDSTEPRRR